MSLTAQVTTVNGVQPGGLIGHVGYRAHCPSCGFLGRTVTWRDSARRAVRKHRCR